MSSVVPDMTLIRASLVEEGPGYSTVLDSSEIAAMVFPSGDQDGEKYCLPAGVRLRTALLFRSTIKS